MDRPTNLVMSLDARHAAGLYLDLLKKCVTRYVFEDGSAPFVPTEHGSELKKALKSAFCRLLRARGLELRRTVGFDRNARLHGRDRPAAAETMIGLKRLDNLQQCIASVVDDDVPGDLVETGVWRGGAAIFMRGALAAYGDQTRKVWCADSFRGLPPPDPSRYSAARDLDWHNNSYLEVSLEQVQRNFDRYGLLDDRVKFLVGWFKDTLPAAPIERLALMRLDGDMYESTMDALQALYGRLSPGGYVIVDDYGLRDDACRRAVHDFRRMHGISDAILDIDGWGAYWRRGA